MNQQERRAEIVRQLREAGAAHSEYETTELHGEYDQQWAEWYAHYLNSHGWNDLFTRVWADTDLADALKQANVDQRSKAPGEHWQEYYADQFSKVE